jgi:hypothetical protein
LVRPPCGTVAARTHTEPETQRDFAFAAVEEAEYAVLDATLARMNADGVATS